LKLNHTLRAGEKASRPRSAEGVWARAREGAPAGVSRVIRKHACDIGLGNAPSERCGAVWIAQTRRAHETPRSLRSATLSKPFPTTNDSLPWLLFGYGTG